MDCQTLYDDRKTTNYMKTIDGARIGDSHKKKSPSGKRSFKAVPLSPFEKAMIVKDYQNEKITRKIEVRRRRLKILSSLRFFFHHFSPRSMAYIVVE